MNDKLLDKAFSEEFDEMFSDRLEVQLKRLLKRCKLLEDENISLKIENDNLRAKLVTVRELLDI